MDISTVLDEATRFAQTPIFTACVLKEPNPDTSLRMIKMLVSLGVDPKREDTLKQSPLFYACREGLSSVIDFLLTEGGNQVNRQDKYGQTPIYYAVREGRVDIVRQLIGYGADYDICDTKNQRPIYYAIQ